MSIKRTNKIIIEGRLYPVVENLGFVHSRGMYAKVVMTEDGERIAARVPGKGMPWKFQSPIMGITISRMEGQ